MGLAESILLALIAFIPVVFYRGTTEVFEFPKTELLATGALALAAIAGAREWERAHAAGFAAWVKAVPGRVAADARADPLGGAILLFLGSALLSTVASIRPELSLFGAHESCAGLKTALATAALYFTARRFSAGERGLARIAGAAAMGLLIAVLYAIAQHMGFDPFGWTRSATLGGLRRVPGTLGHANHLGAYIAMCLPLVVWLAARAATRRSRLLYVGLAALSLPVLAATLSRGAWVAAAGAIAVHALLAWRTARPPARKRVDRRAVLAAALLALAAFLAPLFTPLRSEILTRFRQITDVSAPSTQSRMHLWRAGVSMAADRPISGVGTDAYVAAFPRYRTPEYWSIEWNGLSAKAHSEPIQIAATQGILGLLAGLLVVGFAVRAVLRVSRHGNTSVRAGCAAAAGSLTAFAIQDLASFTVAATGALAAAMAGWLSGTARSHAGEAEALLPGRRAWIAGIGLALVLWIPLVAFPWLAELAAAPGLRAAFGSSARASHLERAAALAPWDARYLSELGRTRLAQAYAPGDSVARWENLAHARRALEGAVRIAPESAEIRALLARTLASQGATRPDAVPFERVRAEFTKALALEPTNANVLELASQGYLELGRTAEARAVALRCVSLFPDFALPMADLGLAALIEGRAADAADTLTLALQRNWHGEGAAEMAAKDNYVAALREMRLGEVLGGKR